MRYRGVYPGIDLLFHGGEGRLEYDFEVSPGADPGAIRVAFEGASDLRLGGDGTLRLQAGLATLDQPPPEIFEREGAERKVDVGRYQLLGARAIGFPLEVTAAERRIDPVLIYSTYLGGSVGDQAEAIAVDSAGSAYLAGLAYSPDFPLKNPFQSAYGGQTGQFLATSTGFVSKFGSDGSSLVYSTYLGGTSGADGGPGDRALAIAVDDAGHAFVAGSTASFDFPVTDAGYQTALAGSIDAFLTALSANGSSLVYSTYLGGDGNDGAKGVALGPSGQAYLCGYTGAGTFPLLHAFEKNWVTDVRVKNRVTDVRSGRNTSSAATAAGA